METDFQTRLNRIDGCAVRRECLQAAIPTLSPPTFVPGVLLQVHILLPRMHASIVGKSCLLRIRSERKKRLALENVLSTVEAPETVSTQKGAVSSKRIGWHQK